MDKTFFCTPCHKILCKSFEKIIFDRNVQKGTRPFSGGYKMKSLQIK